MARRTTLKLAEVLTSNFAQLDAAPARQARLTADAVYELCTPLALILTHAQNGISTTSTIAGHSESFANGSVHSRTFL